MVVPADSFLALPPMVQAAGAGVFTWMLTALGAAAVFARRRPSAVFMDGMLGFAAGVMLGASIWSLLAPAIRLGGKAQGAGWVPALAGFVAGLLVLRGVDRVLPHLHAAPAGDYVEGVRTKWHRSTLLVLAIALHHIPEALALGVAFGAASLERGVAGGATASAAVALAIGLGVQNVPEGLAVALPLRRLGMRPLRSFCLGQLTAAAEPAAAALGAGALLLVGGLLPYALGFAAGAMVYVVVEELLPEAHRSGHSDIASVGTGLGFTFMTALAFWLG